MRNLLVSAITTPNISTCKLTNISISMCNVSTGYDEYGMCVCVQTFLCISLFPYVFAILIKSRWYGVFSSSKYAYMSVWTRIRKNNILWTCFANTIELVILFDLFVRKQIRACNIESDQASIHIIWWFITWFIYGLPPLKCSYDACVVR